MATTTLSALLLVPALAQAPQAHRTRWEVNQFTWVKLVPREGGSEPNEHPRAMDAQALAQQLAAITFKTDEGDKPLFEKSELQDLLKPLTEALSVAGPGEDLLLLSTHRRGGGLMSPPLGITARLFIKGGSLNVIVHDTRSEFMGRYIIESTPPTFQWGSRAKASQASLRAEGATSRRNDWLVLPLAAAPVSTPAPAPAPASAPAPTAAPVPTAASAPVPAAEPAPAKAPRDEAYYREREERLRALKRLRDQNLLTEEEYQAKRKEVLKDL